MQAKLHALTISTDVLRRGFWLYVWAVALRHGKQVYYVGRTGDSSSIHAQSPFSRVSGHLGPNKRANALKRHLEKHGISMDECKQLQLVAYGPLYNETSDKRAHADRRDKTHALERDLRDAMQAAGYTVLNTVHCRKPSNAVAWKRVQSALAQHFPKLKAPIST